MPSARPAATNDLPTSRVKAASDAGRVGRQRGDPGVPELSTHHRSPLRDAPLLVGEALDAGLEERIQADRELRGAPTLGNRGARAARSRTDCRLHDRAPDAARESPRLGAMESSRAAAASGGSGWTSTRNAAVAAASGGCAASLPGRPAPIASTPGPTRDSRRASIAGSASWMSSTTRMTGPARASPATSARAASAIAAAVAGRSEAPTAKRSGSEPVVPSSRSTDSSPTASSHPASGAYATPSPYGGQRPHRAIRPARSTAAARSLDLPIPGSPTIRPTPPVAARPRRSTI